MEFASYHAIVACVAAGSGVAVVPRSIVSAVPHQGDIAFHRLPAAIAQARTLLIWRRGQSSSALDALRQQLLVKK
jgi:DNA-binding transcriptional LysR family regulator